MRRFFTNVISVLFSEMKFSIIKLLNMNEFYFHFIERFSPNVIIELEKKGKMYIGKRVRAHSGCIFKVRSKGKLVIEEGCSFNYNCMIFCHDSIVIGKGVEFGPDVKIYDHDHDYKAEGGIKAQKYKTGEITIGENTWIGANTIILRGTTIGANCVIAAGSVLKGNYPEGSVVIQKRKTQILS